MDHRPSLLHLAPASGGRLLLGGRREAEAAVREDLGIRLLVSLVAAPAALSGRRDIEPVALPFADRQGVLPPEPEASTAVRRAADAVRAGHGVLVHCGGGRNRGPWFAGRVLVELGEAPDRALARLQRSHRADVLSNAGLRRDLLERRPADGAEEGRPAGARRAAVPEVRAVRLDGPLLVFVLGDGREVAIPVRWSRRLEAASPEARRRWSIVADGRIVAWPALDEHIGVWTPLGLPEEEDQRPRHREERRSGGAPLSRRIPAASLTGERARSRTDR